jgi:hypothetical protein
VLVISTAGWDRTSIAWEVRQHAERERSWYFSPRGQCASWIRPEWLAEQRRTLPAHVFARLHECRWVEGAGAWLLAEQVDGIFAGVPEGEGTCCLGLDIGISRDRTAVALVRAAGDLRVVEALRLVAPSRGERVDLMAVEADVEALARQYACPVHCDPYQAIGMAQRLRQRGIEVCEYPFTGEKRRQLFARLLDLVSTGRLRAHPHEELRREMLSLEVKETLGGWRVDHRAGGHDDAVIAVSLALAGLAEEALGELIIVSGSAPRSAQAAQAAADEDYRQQTEAACQAVLDGIRQRGAFGFRD